MDENLEHIENYIGKDHRLHTFGHSKVSLIIEVESKLNYDKIYFSHTEFELARCLEVFLYVHSVETFSFTDCARKTGISYHNVRRIYDKYVKNN
ncbi:MAG: hypothetical protein QM499_00820 [Flavobacteriaceae bacterium]